MLSGPRRLRHGFVRGLRGVSQVLADPTAWNTAPTAITRLSNGVRVVTQETFSDTSSFGIFVDGGRRDESKSTCGASYLTEQLARHRAPETEIESIGGVMNVEVGREQSAYTLSLGAENQKKGLELLMGVFANQKVESFDKDKQSILRHLDSTALPNRAVIEDRLHLCAFRDSSLGFTNVGPFEGIDSLTANHLKAYLQSVNVADKVILVSSGAVNHEEMVKYAAASPLASLPQAGPYVGNQKPYFCGAELNYRNDEMGGTAYLAVGVEGVPHRSSDAVSLMVAASVLGSYKKNRGLVPGTISANRTINNVANKMDVGCADMYEVFSLNYKDTGIFGFYAEADEVAVEHCIGELMLSINMLSYSVTDEEVERAKRELKLKLFGNGGSSAEACKDIGRQMLAYGRVVPPAEMILRIDAVDREEVNRVAYQYLNDQEVAVTGLGPLHGMPQYLDLRRATTMVRY